MLKPVLGLGCMKGVAHVYRLYKKKSVIYSRPVVVCSLLSNR